MGASLEQRRKNDAHGVILHASQDFYVLSIQLRHHKDLPISQHCMKSSCQISLLENRA